VISWNNFLARIILSDKEENMMKTTRLLIIIISFSVFLVQGISLDAQEKSSLDAQFLNPPGEYRSTVLWFWNNGMFNKEGITGDLEAMKRVGLGGGKIFNGAGIEGPVRFASDEWFELTAHAAREADRLGLKIGLNMTEGFTAAGGPWITPEQSMQRVVWSETEVEGPGPVPITLEKPDVTPIDTKVFKLMNIKFYRDIRVYGVPQVGESRIMYSDLKSGMMPHHFDPAKALLKTPADSVAPTDIIPGSRLIDLTEHMDENGNLKWDAPPGKWTILRMGTASTGACTRPGSEKTRGLEADKFNRETVQFHFENLCKPLLDKEGVNTKGLGYFAVDSWEADGQNWSPVLAAEFEKRRGYSLYPYLPVLTGRVVESIDVSERFLWDFRRTIADCIYANFYVFLQELCEKHGMTFSSEPYTRAAFDGMAAAEAVGVPIATFWQGGGVSRAHNEGKWSSSAVNVAGGKVVSSEAFPAIRSRSGWVNHPWTFKMKSDYAYASGVNLISFHCMSLQPWDHKLVHKPGMTFRHWGSQYSRHNTWWEQSLGWQQYLARCNFMLQQGRFQSEALFMTPEEIPGLELRVRYSLPFGYDWDMTSARMVRDELLVKEGMICAPSGMKYHVLILPEIEEISLPLLKKLRKLVADGAKLVVSSRPKTSRGLENYPGCKTEVRDIVSEMWQNLDGSKVKEQAYGLGKLYWASGEEVLKKLGAQPDVIVEAEGENSGKLPINYLHRYTPDTDFFFVSSSLQKPASGLLSFRISGKQPEFWYPDNGRIEACPVYEEKDGRTIVPMIFDPCGSVFVVFRDKADSAPAAGKVSIDGKVVLSASERINPFEATKELFQSGGSCRLEMQNQEIVEEKVAALELRSLDEDWKVSFEGLAAPAETTFENLIPWNEHPDDAIRYFSGDGIYRKTLEVKKKKGRHIWLDLGEVEVIATVRVNGKEVGTLWKPPFLMDITDALQKGENELEIRVSNLWVNRLIGDEQFSPDMKFDSRGELLELPGWFVNNTTRPEQGRKTFTTFRHYEGTEALMPSGLVGPVSLITRTENEHPLVEKIALQLFAFSRNPEYKEIITENPKPEE